MLSKATETGIPFGRRCLRSDTPNDINVMEINVFLMYASVQTEI